MKLSTIEAHKNSDERLNTTHHTAWVLATRISHWSIWNLLLWFKPLKLYSVMIMPVEVTDPLEPFESSMFEEGSFLEHTALNHYVNLYKPGKPKKRIVLNCGALLQNFAYSSYAGFSALKEVIKIAYDSYNTKETTEPVQKDSPSDPQGGSGVSNWESDGGATGSDRSSVSSGKSDKLSD